MFTANEPRGAQLATDTLELNLSQVVPSLAGPRRPQDLVPLRELGDELLDVGLVEVALGDGGLDLGERQDAHLLPLEQQTLDLFELLQIYD